MNGKHIDCTIKTNQLAVFKIYFTFSKWIYNIFILKKNVFIHFNLILYKAQKSLNCIATEKRKQLMTYQLIIQYVSSVVPLIWKHNTTWRV